MCAVKGVNNPAIGAATHLLAALFGQDRVVGKRRRDLGANQRFGGMVHLGDNIAAAFRGDLQGAMKGGTGQRPGFAGSGCGKRQGGGGGIGHGG